MKRFMMGVFALVCAGALCAGLAACGGGSGSSAASSASADASASAAASASASSSVAASSAGALQPAANVDPAAIDPGAPDIWRLDGDASAEGIRFEKSGNEAGLAFIRVSASGEDGDGEYNLIITDDKHLRTPLGTAPKIDIVFLDDRTCYDFVKDSTYIRVD